MSIQITKQICEPQEKIITFVYAIIYNNMLVYISLFFCFLRKCQDGDHLKFGEALHFYIHSSFGPKNTFFIIFIQFFIQIWRLHLHFFIEMEKIWRKRLPLSSKKKTFILKWCFLAPFGPPQRAGIHCGILVYF